MSISETASLVTAAAVTLLAARSLRAGTVTKKRHFKARVEQVERSIWDLEFSREKYKALREGVRQQYDRVNEQLTNAKAMLEREKGKDEKDKATIENLEGLVAKYEPDVQYMRKQIDALDQQIDSEDNPEACTQKIAASRELKAMLVEHLSKLR